MPSSVRVGSRTTYTPGVYTQVDASALDAPSPTAVGIVALIGEGIGGAPYSAIQTREDIAFYTSAAQLQRDYPAGDLLEAANICFNPSTVTGGAQSVVALKANPSTQAAVTLQGQSGPSLKLRARAWGLGGNGIQVVVGAGSASGLSLTITQGNTVESADNLGDDPVASVTYDTSRGWASLTLTKDTQALVLAGQKGVDPTPGEFTQTALTAAAPVKVRAADGDLGKVATLYGTDANGAAMVESVPLRASAQTSTGVFAKLLGVELSDTAQQVDFLDGADKPLASLAANAQHAGMATLPTLVVGNVPVTATGQEAATIVLAGSLATGGALAQAVVLANGSGVPTVQAFGKVTKAAVGALTKTVTLAATAVRVPTGGPTTIAQAAGAMRAVPGVNARVTVGDEAAPLASLDPVAGAPLGSQAVVLVSDVEAVVDWVNAQSQLVSAEAVAGASSAPKATTSPVLLSGGTESPASPADYQACLNLLKKVRVNLVVPLTCDQGVQAAAEAHCSYMSGVGQSERMCHLGAMDPGLTKPASRRQVVAQAQALNSAYACIIPNGIVRYDSLGNLTTFAPHFAAVAMAGMRAGARVNTPMTRKGMSVIGYTQDPSFDPVDDSDSLIAAGVCFLRRFDAQGVAVVRDVTTWLRDNNPVRSSSMVAYATGINVYTYRTSLEGFVGQDEFSGGFNQIKVYAVQVLTQLLDARQIFDFSPPTGERVGDAILVDQVWQYDPETNFILPTIHLTNPQQQAA